MKVKSAVSKYVMVIATVLVILFFTIATGGKLLYPQNVNNLIARLDELGSYRRNLFITNAQIGHTGRLGIDDRRAAQNDAHRTSRQNGSRRPGSG